jgi:hypothetical protein
MLSFELLHQLLVLEHILCDVSSTLHIYPLNLSLYLNKSKEMVWVYYFDCLLYKYLCHYLSLSI